MIMSTYNIRSPEKDAEKNMVLCKKVDDITPFDGTVYAFLPFTLGERMPDGRNGPMLD
jgi:hypothetical protein